MDSESFGTDEDWLKLNESRNPPDKQELTEFSTLPPSLLADQNHFQTTKSTITLSFPVNCLVFFFFLLSYTLNH